MAGAVAVTGAVAGPETVGDTVVVGATVGAVFGATFGAMGGDGVTGAVTAAAIALLQTREPSASADARTSGLDRINMFISTWTDSSGWRQSNDRRLEARFGRKGDGAG